MKIETMKVADLKPAAFNPRRISEAALAGLKSSIDRFGLVEPIIYNERTGNIMACEQLNRMCYGMEISPAYCDVIIKRWETFTGQKAVKSE